MRAKRFVPYIPGLLHRDFKREEGSPVTPDQKTQLKQMMKKSGGMTGEKGQELGVFQRMISYDHMPIGLMREALAYKLTPAETTSINDYIELINLGLRPAEDTVFNWLRGYYGSTSSDIPPRLEEEFRYELALWQAEEHESHGRLREITSGSNDPQNEFIGRLGIHFAALQRALVNPFQIDKEAYVSPELLILMKNLGLFKLKIPKQYGGLGLNQREYDLVLRALTHSYSGTLGGVVSAHSTIGSAPLVKYGTTKQQEYYLPRIAEGDYLCAFGLTEPESGTDAMDSAGTIAKKSKDGNSWIINGRKVFITNTHRSGIMYAMAKVDDGKGEPKPTVFIIELPFRITDTKEDTLRKRQELKSQGLYISEPLDGNTIRGSNQAYMEFHDFKLPVKNNDGMNSILGGDEAIGSGAKIIFNSLNAGRAGFGTFCAEAASGAFELALIEAVQRKRFDLYGGTLADLPTVKKYLSTMAVKISALNATTELTTALIDKYPNMNIIAEAAAIKAFATEEAWDVAQTANRMLGGMGTMKGQAMELVLRDLWIPLIVEGVNEALKQHLVLVSAKPSMRDSKSIGGIYRLTKSLVHFENGGLNTLDAFWIQKETKKLSLKAKWLGFKNGDKTALKQHEIISIADRAIELYAATAVMLKLQDESISDKERAALEQFVTNVKNRSSEYPDCIADLYIDDAKIAVGEAKCRANEISSRGLKGS